MSPPPQEQLRRLGQSLREIDPATLQHHADEGPVRWFQGTAGTELTLWLDGAGVPKHAQLIFCGVSVEWSSRGLSTGTFSPQGSTAGGRYDPYVLQVAAGIDEEVVRSALVLLEAAEVDPVVSAPLAQALQEALAGQDR